jgi:uncharacterized membrane-anchored protein
VRRLGIFALFVATAIAQWAVPGSLIWKSERILAEGKQFRFRTRPVDPADLFRGRYVAIGIERDTVDLDRVPAEGEFRRGSVMYASLAVDAAGFAYPAALTPVPPPGADAVRVRVGWANRQPGIGAKNISVEYPFARYYAGEKSAPRIEGAVANPEILRQGETWVTVRVLGGDALIEDLFIAGKPAREYRAASK